VAGLRSQLVQVTDDLKRNLEVRMPRMLANCNQAFVVVTAQQSIECAEFWQCMMGTLGRRGGGAFAVRGSTSKVPAATAGQFGWRHTACIPHVT